MRTRTLLLTAIGCAAFALPATAPAATITQDASGALVFRAADGEQNNLSLQAIEGSGTITFYTGAGAAVTSAPSACEISDWGWAECATPPAVTFELGDAKDWYATSSGVSASLPVTVNGGAGDDRLDGYHLNETLNGGDGDDTVKGSTGDDVVDGGAGNDEVDGYEGRDRVSGGEGNDTLHGDGYEDPSADVVDGGPGVDTVESDYSTRRIGDFEPQLSITLGGGADDGRPGEGDDVRNVERLVMSKGGKFVGTDAAEYVKLHQVGDDGQIVGLGGNDELRGGDGADKIDGGTGDDKLDGGFGDDAITGGPGRDQISADLAGGDCGPLWCKTPWGNDVVEARDGEADSVSCGAGQDRVVADTADTVAPDCEQVERQGAVPVTPTEDPKQDGPQPTPGAGVTLKSASPTKLRAALRGGLKVSVAGVARGTKVSAKAAGRIVATGRTNAAGVATLRFTKAAKRSLGRKRKVKLTIVVAGARETLMLTR